MKNPNTIIIVKRIGYIFLLALMAMPLMAETYEQRVQWRNELRIGWGDQMFETLIWRPTGPIATSMSPSFSRCYLEDYHYDQHLWIEYQYRFTYWFSVGGMLDLSEVHWDMVWRDGTGAEYMRDPGHYFYNAVLMPTARFTYFHHPYVNLYSAVGLGMGINGGTELNSKGHKTDVGLAFNLTVIGVSANYRNFFTTMDFGGMTSLKDTNTIFMLGSRIINVGIGVRF